VVLTSGCQEDKPPDLRRWVKILCVVDVLVHHVFVGVRSHSLVHHGRTREQDLAQQPGSPSLWARTKQKPAGSEACRSKMLARTLVRHPCGGRGPVMMDDPRGGLLSIPSYRRDSVAFIPGHLRACLGTRLRGYDGLTAVVLSVAKQNRQARRACRFNSWIPRLKRGKTFQYMGQTRTHDQVGGRLCRPHVYSSSIFWRFFVTFFVALRLSNTALALSTMN
jgi:hypothetical protein